MPLRAIGAALLPKRLGSSGQAAPDRHGLADDYWRSGNGLSEMNGGNRQRGRQTTINYVGQQRMQQKGRTGMMANMDPNAAQRGYNMMNNGGMNDLRQTAMKNGL